MIDERISLLNNSIVSLSDNDNQYEFQIIEEIARGSSIIAYKAFHEKLGYVILKEYYPIQFDLIRENDCLLCEDEEEWEEEKENFVKKCSSFIQAIHLNLYDTNIFNNLPQTLIYEKDDSCNNTLYMIQSYAYGSIYSDYIEETLCELFQNIRSIARIVADLHKQDYIVFDVKPSNLFIVKASDQNFFNLVDFDSITKLSDIDEFTEIKSTLNYHDPDVDLTTINETYDIYSIGCIVKKKLEKYSYDFSCVHSKVKLLVDEFIMGTCCKQEKRYNDEQVLNKIDEILEYLQIKFFLQSMTLHKQTFFGYEQEFNELHDILSANHYVVVSGMSGIGKKAFVYEYAYRYQNCFKNIQIVPFINDWLCTFKQLQFNHPVYDQDILSLIQSVLSQCENTLIVISDYISNKQNDRILDLLKKSNATFLLTSQNLFSDIKLYGLDKESAYQLFAYTYGKDIKKNEVSLVHSIIEEFEYNPAMIQLFAVGASQTNVSLWHSPIKTFIQNIHPKKIVNYQNKIESLDYHIQNILNLKQFSEQEKEILSLLYYSETSGLFESFLLDYGVNQKDLLHLESECILTRTNGKVQINSIFKKEMILKAFQIEASVNQKLFHFLSKNFYPNLNLSILTKCSIVDPLFNQLFTSLLSRQVCLEADISLLKEAINAIQEYTPYLTQSALDKIDAINMRQILWNREGKVDKLLDEIEHHLSTNTSMYQTMQLNQAYKLRNQSKELKEKGDFARAIESLLKADLIFKEYPIGYVDIIEDCLTICDYCNTMGADDKRIFYANKAMEVLQKSGINDHKLIYRCYMNHGLSKASTMNVFHGMDDFIKAYSYATNNHDKLILIQEIVHTLTLQVYINQKRNVDDFIYDLTLKILNTVELIQLADDQSLTNQVEILINYCHYMNVCGKFEEAHDLMVQTLDFVNQHKIELSKYAYNCLALFMFSYVSMNYKHRFKKSDLVKIVMENHLFHTKSVQFNTTLGRLEAYYALGTLFAYLALFYQEFKEGELKEIGLNYLQKALALIKNASSGYYKWEIKRIEEMIQFYGNQFPVRMINPKERETLQFNEQSMNAFTELSVFLDQVQKEFV